MAAGDLQRRRPRRRRSVRRAVLHRASVSGRRRHRSRTEPAARRGPARLVGEHGRQGTGAGRVGHAGPAGPARRSSYVAALAVSEPVLQARTVLDILSRISVETVHDADALRLYGQDGARRGRPAARHRLPLPGREAAARSGRLGLLSHVLDVQGGPARPWGLRSATRLTEEGRRLAADTGQPIGASARSERGPVSRTAGRQSTRVVLGGRVRSRTDAASDEPLPRVRRSWPADSP